ncbi:MAG: TrkA family potassium uptake protein [Christensenellaceae bacterium]|nr:TrkA family potassium uptake protein [Christensenellaceae bacterium]
MFRKKKKEKTAYGIIGLGRFGSALAKELASSGAELLVLDKDEEKIREIREYTENAMIVSSLDKKTLEETGIQNCDIAVVCVGSEMDVSILTTLHLVSLGIPKVIAKASSEEHGIILEKLGAEIVYPEHDMAVRLGKRLENTGMLDYVSLSERISISKLRVPASVVGKNVIEANFRGNYGLNIIAVENNGSVTEAVTPQYVFCDGDILYLAGSKDGLAKLAEQK